MRLRSVLCASAGFFATRGSVAFGQEVAGSVVDAGTLRPLIQVRVTVEGGTQTVVTDSRGRFKLTGLSGSTVVAGSV